MSATLPATLLVGHIMSDAEWNQLIRGITAISNIEVFWSISLATSTASLTYVNVTNAFVTFTKHYDSSTSDVGVIVLVSARNSGANIAISFGINDGTTDHDMASLPSLTANKHYSQHGFSTFTGLAAGTYTLQLRWKNGTSGSSAVIDGNDTISIVAIELAK